MEHLNEQGQPLNRSYNRKRLTTRAIDELLGLCKGVAADNIVTLEEATFLLEWMERNRQAANLWPANILYQRIRHVLSDKILDENEAVELLELLQEITGGVIPDDESSGSSSTNLPLDLPAPRIMFEDRLFCFTGKCIHGTRKQCEQEVETRGGEVKRSPTLNTHYLVIGVIGSRDWIHSTHGRKIEHAVKIKEDGYPIAIISERHWANSLDNT